MVNGTRAFLPILVEQDEGAIVNTSSVFGLVGMPTQSAYCSAKFAVRGFTDSLRQELRGTGVTAINVHPGGIDTNIVRNARFRQDPEGRGRSQDQMAKEFAAITMTQPDKAAEIVHRGVERGKARILVGPDAYMFDTLARLTPTHYYEVLGRLQGFLKRAASATTAGSTRSPARSEPYVQLGHSQLLCRLGLFVERRIVGAHHQQVGVAALVQLREAGMVVAHLLSIESQQRLHHGDETGNRRLADQSAWVVERVTAVQHPAVTGIDSHARVSAGVAGQRDENDPGRDVVEFLGGREAPPLLADRVCARRSWGRVPTGPLGSGSSREATGPALRRALRLR